MVLVFWVLNAPHRVGIWIGFGLGILLDGLQGNVFGLHPLGLALVAWLTRLSYRRVRVFSIWQTGGLLLAIMLAYQLTGYFVLRFMGEDPASALYWLPSLTSALVWPTVMLSLRSFIHRF
jgi:rod shape-determining protein MreD